jgi:hypothetical protein
MNIGPHMKVLEIIYIENNVIIATILIQLMHILLNFVYQIYLWNGNYNTFFHVIIISIYY